MCGSILETAVKTAGAAVSGGATLALDKAKKKKGEKAINKTAEAARSSASKNRRAGIKQEKTRASQISKFRANVASGGAKRAANV